MKIPELSQMGEQGVILAELKRRENRGILAEIAREEGVSRQAIHEAARLGNPRILIRCAEKIAARREARANDHADLAAAARRIRSAA